jgi:hypothetical protein
MTCDVGPFEEDAESFVFKNGQIISCISGFLPIADIDAIVGRPKFNGKNNAFL